MSTGKQGARRACGRALLTRNVSTLSIATGLIALSAATAFAQEQVQPQQVASQGQVYEPAYFARFAPKTAADMVGNIPGFSINDSDDSDARGFGQAKQNVLINGRREIGRASCRERVSPDV